MANEIHVDYVAGETLYVAVRNLTGEVWYPVGEVFEVWGTGGRDAADYAITLVGDDGGRYVGNFDTNVPAGYYTVQAFEQADSAPADTDSLIGSGEIIWNGTAEEFVIDSNGRVDIGAVSGGAVANVDAFKADVSALATSAALAATDGKVDNIKTKTDNLPANTATELDGIDSAIAGLNDISTGDVETALTNYGVAEKTSVSAIKSQTDNFDGMITIDSAGNFFTAQALKESPTAEMSEAELHSALDNYTNKDNWKANLAILNDISVADILSAVGITEGGTWSLAKAMKVMTAWACGRWKLKSGETDVYELIDPDDENTVIVEMQISSETPYRTVSVKI